MTVDQIIGSALDTNKSKEIDRTVRTLIIDRSELFRAGLARILAETCFQVVATSASLDDLPNGALDYNGALLLLGSDEADIAFARISRTKAINPSLRIVVLSDSLSPHEVLLAITSGADAFLVKNEIGPHLFLKSIELTLLGAAVIPQGLVLTPMFSEHDAEFGTDIRLPGSDHDTLLPVQTARAGPGLSAREQLVLRRLMEGASNKVIARDIGIAETTVKVHVKSLLRKIQVSNRPQAAMWGINHLSEAGEVLSSSGSINQGE